MHQMIGFHQPPLVSVIIPCFNSQKTIRESLDTVLKQSWKNIEILVIDDGSTDSTKNIINSISDKRIHYHRKSNSGVSASRNMGLGLCKGKYICFLDSDDFMLPKNIEEKLRVAEGYNLDLITADDFAIHGGNCARHYKEISHNLENIVEYCEDQRFSVSRIDFSVEMSDRETRNFDNFFIISPSCVIKNFPRIPPFSTRSIFFARSLLTKLECFDTSLTSAEDIKFWFELSLECKTGIGVIPRILTVYNSFFSTWKLNPNYSKNDHVFYKSCLSKLDYLDDKNLARKYYSSAWLVAEIYRPFYFFSAFKKNPKSIKYIKALINSIARVALVALLNDRTKIKKSPKLQ